METQAPTQEDIQYLQNNPALAPKFDARFGVGASTNFLQQPENEGQVSQEEQPEAGLLDTLGDMAAAVPDGALTAVQETADFMDEVMPLGSIGVGEGGVEFTPPPSGSWTRDVMDTVGITSPEDQGAMAEDSAVRLDEAIDDPDTVAGGITKSISQFVTGFAGGGRALKAAGWAAGKGPAMLRAMSQGGIADFFAFDEHEGNVFNLVNDILPEKSELVEEWFATSDEDGVIEGRLKNLFSGALVGAGLDIATGAGKAAWNSLKRSKEAAALRSAGKPQEAAEVLATAAEEADAILKAPEDGAALPKVDKPKVDRVEMKALHTWEPEIKLTEPEAAAATALGVDASQLKLVTKRLGEDNIPAIIRELDVDLKDWDADRAYGAIKAVEDMVKQYRPSSISDTMTAAKVKKIAESYLQEPEALLSRLEADAKNMHEVSARIEATDAVVSVMLRKAAETSDDAEFDRLYDLIEQTMFDRGLVATHLGRGLQSLQNPRTLLPDVENSVDAAKKAVTGRRKYGGDRQQFQRRLKQWKDSPNVAKRLVAHAATHKTWDVVNEYWRNSVLSGIPTHVLGMASGGTEILIKPLENAAKVALVNRSGADGVRALRGSYAGMFQASRETFGYLGSVLHGTLGKPGVWDDVAISNPMGNAVKTFKSEQPVLDPMATFMDSTGNEVDSTAIRGTLGRVVRIPQRALSAADEIMKGIAYRSQVTSDATTMAWKLVDEGVLTKDQIGSFVAKKVKASVDPQTGAFTDPKAMQYAREVTFQQDLPANSFGKSIQKLASDVPALRTIALPFVKTPMNLLSHNFERMPAIGLLARRNRDALMKGTPEERAEVLVKQAMGSATLGVGMLMSENGLLVGNLGTGRERDQAQMGGKQSYSIKVGDSYIQFSRMDPRFITWGLLADFHQMRGEMSETEIGEFVGAFGAVTSELFMNRAVFMSASNFVEAFSSGDPEKTKQWAARYMGSYVPTAISNLTMDREIKEIRDLMDGVLARVPGASGMVEPRRNILGEVVERPAGWPASWMSPISVSKQLDEPVREMLAGMEHVFTPPKRTEGTLDFTKLKSPSGQSFYDRWQELTGEVKDSSGKRLADHLNAFAEDPQFQQLLKVANETDRERGYVSKASELIQRVVQGYRQKAFNTAMNEADFSNVKDAYIAERMKMKAAPTMGFKSAQDYLQNR